MKLSKVDKEYLKNYKAENYEHPSLAIDLLIFTVDKQSKELKILLIKRETSPFKDGYSLPGGFVAINETFEKTVKKELRNKVGVDDIHFEQLYTFDDINRDPRTRVISVAYMALIPQEKINSSVKENILWLPVKNISKTNIAFDHENIIKVGIERLKGKLSYTDIAFNLLDDINRFSIGELQFINEAILETTLDVPNFRRSFFNKYLEPGLVEDTGESCFNSKRPSHYYRVIKED